MTTYDKRMKKRQKVKEKNTKKLSKITDQEKLFRIAMAEPPTDDQEKFCYATDKSMLAAERITDQKMLLEIAMNTVDSVALAAIGNMTDERNLYQIAQRAHGKEHYRCNCEKAAVERISDQDLLYQLALDDDSCIQISAAVKITDQKLIEDLILREIANDHSSLLVRCLLKNVKDPKQKLSLTLAACDSNTCMQAIKESRLSESEYASILMTAVAYDSASGAIIQKISDPALLAALAKDAAGWCARNHAVTRLSDQKLLEQIALSDKTSNVRTTAVKRITDQSVLAEIAKNDPDASVRSAAVKKITDQTLLEEIAKTDKNESVRRTAIANMKVGDTRIELSLKHTDPDVRYGAVFALPANDPRLATIAAHDASEKVRKLALGRITDKELLLRVARGMNYEAFDRMSELGLMDASVVSDFGTAKGKRAAQTALNRQTLHKKLKNHEHGAEIWNAYLKRNENELNRYPCPETVEACLLILEELDGAPIGTYQIMWVLGNFYCGYPELKNRIRAGANGYRVSTHSDFGGGGDKDKWCHSDWAPKTFTFD